MGNLIDYTPFIIGYSAVAFAEATQVDISPWSVPVFVSCTVLFLAVQAFLVATRSQSIGKFCLGTQTVIHNGARAGFWRITLLRNALPNFIPCFNLIDPFFIFGMRRQCLHDMISGTYVVHYSAERR